MSKIEALRHFVLNADCPIDDVELSHYIREAFREARRNERERVIAEIDKHIQTSPTGQISSASDLFSFLKAPQSPQSDPTALDAWRESAADSRRNK